jgi:hypothetical protein
MNYWSSDLGFRPTGAVVEVSLTGNAANVMLVDSSNLTSYKAGQSFRYVGGHYTQSPVRLATPSAGHWYVLIDYGGAVGSGTASVRVIRG